MVVILLMIRVFNSTEVKREVTTGKTNDQNKTIACNDDNIIQSNRFILKSEKKKKLQTTKKKKKRNRK